MDIMTTLSDNIFLLISANNISKLNELNMKIYFIKYHSCEEEQLKNQLYDCEKMNQRCKKVERGDKN